MVIVQSDCMRCDIDLETRSASGILLTFPPCRSVQRCVHTHRTILQEVSALYTSLLEYIHPSPTPLYILPVYLSESCTGPACGGSPSVTSPDHPSSLLSALTRQRHLTSRHGLLLAPAAIFVEGSARSRCCKKNLRSTIGIPRKKK